MGIFGLLVARYRKTYLSDFQGVGQILRILAVYIDGIEVAGRHVVAAVGLDDTGEKHLLGLVRGSSENAGVVKDLLQSLLTRGIDASAYRLFRLARAIRVLGGRRRISRPAQKHSFS